MITKTLMMGEKKSLRGVGDIIEEKMECGIGKIDYHD